MSVYGKNSSHWSKCLHDLHVAANFNPFLCGNKDFMNVREKVLLFPFPQSEVVREVFTQPISRHLGT